MGRLPRVRMLPGKRHRLADQIITLLNTKGIDAHEAAGRSGLSVEQVELACYGKGRWRNAVQLVRGLGKRGLVIRDAVMRPHKTPLVTLAHLSGMSINTVQEVLRHCDAPSKSNGGLLVSSIEAVLFAMNPSARIEVEE